jgi:hypothetical protein
MKKQIKSQLFVQVCENDDLILLLNQVRHPFRIKLSNMLGHQIISKIQSNVGVFVQYKEGVSK